MLKREVVFSLPFYRQSFKESYRKKLTPPKGALDDDHLQTNIPLCTHKI